MSALTEEVAYALMPYARLEARVSTEAFDDSVAMWVERAVADMVRVGISEGAFDPDSDYYPLVKAAAILYCKAHFGMDNPNEEMRFWLTSYEQTVTDLMNSGACSYAEEAPDAVG